MTTEGDRSDPRHGDWLTELGRATDAAAGLATICFDLARVLGGVASDAMYRDDLGRLENRVRGLTGSLGPPPAELAALAAALPAARETRNDLAHALRVRDGLYRRVAQPARTREFFTVDSLREARDEMESVRHLGNQALYADGGAAVAAWYAAGAPGAERPG